MPVVCHLAMTKSIEKPCSTLVTVASKQGIHTAKQQTLPERNAPTECQSADTEHRHEFVPRCCSHDFSVHHTETSTPEKNLVNEEQNERDEENLPLPHIERGTVDGKISCHYSPCERNTREHDAEPNWKEAENHRGTAKKIETRPLSATFRVVSYDSEVSAGVSSPFG